MARQRSAAADEAVDAARFRARRNHAQMLRQVIGVDPVDDDAALERREADRERALGHAVARDERARIEPGGREELGEAVRQLGADGLGADAGDAPCARGRSWRRPRDESGVRRARSRTAG